MPRESALDHGRVLPGEDEHAVAHPDPTGRRRSSARRREACRTPARSSRRQVPESSTGARSISSWRGDGPSAARSFWRAAVPRFGPMADDLTATAGVVVDRASVGRLDRRPPAACPVTSGVGSAGPRRSTSTMSPVWMPSSRMGPRTPAGNTARRRGRTARQPRRPRRGRSRASRAARPLRLRAVRWLVDGMNVIGTRPDAWWKDRHAAMVKLVDMLERWAAEQRRGRDGRLRAAALAADPLDGDRGRPRARARAATRPTMRSCACWWPTPSRATIRVVTSDLWLSDRVHAAGASVEPAAPFRALIEEPVMAPDHTLRAQRRREHRLPGRRRRPARPAVPDGLADPARAAVGGAGQPPLPGTADDVRPADPVRQSRDGALRADARDLHARAGDARRARGARRRRQRTRGAVHLRPGRARGSACSPPSTPSGSAR